MEVEDRNSDLSPAAPSSFSTNNHQSLSYIHNTRPATRLILRAVCSATPPHTTHTRARKKQRKKPAPPLSRSAPAPTMAPRRMTTTLLLFVAAAAVLALATPAAAQRRGPPPNLCAGVACLNGGRCARNTGKCQCKPGTAGDLCQSVKPGYYFDRTVKPCPANNWCDGVSAQKTACPTGSFTQGAKKGALADCKTKPGWYCGFSATVPPVCTPYLCESGFYCPGKISVTDLLTQGRFACDACGTGCPYTPPGTTSASICTCAPCPLGALCDSAGDCASGNCNLAAVAPATPTCIAA